MRYQGVTAKPGSVGQQTWVWETGKLTWTPVLIFTSLLMLSKCLPMGKIGKKQGFFPMHWNNG